MNFRKGKIVFFVLLWSIILTVAGCQGGGIAKQKEKAVATINDKVITVNTYNKHLALIKKSYENMYGDKIWGLDVGGRTFLQAVQENVLEKLIGDEVIIQHFQKQGTKVATEEIEKQYKQYVQQMKKQTETEKFLKEHGIDDDFIKEQIKTELYIQKFEEMVRKELNLTDEKLREYYNQHIDTYTNMEVKASHILVEKEEEAKNILEKINKGEDFGELAKKYSKDPGSKEKGGDLGYFSKGMMVPEFEKAAFALKKGEISAPVKTKHGYHIIKVVDTKKETKKFEEVKGNIERTLIDQTMMTKTNDMKKEFKIKKYPENIK